MTIPRIFISIPSFRDTETQWTVKDAFEKAAHPERVFVGICWQFDPKEDLGCFVEPYPYPDQVRAVNFHYKDAKGLGWARAQAFSLAAGEEYCLQIDSHMRFEEGWDEALIDMLARCPSEKAVLSTYVPRYVPPDAKDAYPGEILRTRLEMMAEKGNPQMFHQTMVQVPMGDTLRSGLYRAPFPIGNFLFFPAQVLRDLPLDPHIRFWGEEVTYGARLWTHGWDIYQPDRVVAYHYWRRPAQGKAAYRRTDDAESRVVYKRIAHLLELERSDDAKAVVDIEKYGLGSERPLAGLWEMAGIDWGKRKITEDGKAGRWVSGAGCQVSDKEESDTRHPAPDTLPRIFVNIASYRDVECQWTVKDLFEKAAHPERIFVGICWQFDPKDDQHCFQVATRPEQVRILPVDWREAEGVCWARHQTQLLHDGEEYTLMIDSHMRFVPGWDEMMIAELALCDAAKPVLSCSPMPYEPPDRLSHNINPTFRRVKPFMPDGNIRCQGEAFDRQLPHPVRGAFLVANFVFSRSEIIKEVPYDPYLYFDQEEITYAARLFTHGWDIFSPRRQFLYHYYNDGKQGRPMHWHDLHEEDQKRIRYLRERGLKRFNHMTGYRVSDEADVVRELDLYGFGTVRSLAQFEAFTGVDFKRKVASDKAMRGGFIENLAQYRRAPVRVPEIDGMVHAKFTQPMLEPGDCIPLFIAPDSSGKSRAVELHGGKVCLIAFLPARQAGYTDPFFRALHQQLQQLDQKDFWQIFILDGTAEELAALREEIRVPHQLWADPDRAIARSFGLAENIPAAYVVSPNLRIEQRHAAMAPSALAEASAAACKVAMERYSGKHAQPRVITETAPVLIVPDVFSPEFCAKCMHAFRTGKTFDGTVGAEDKRAYRPDSKVRTDYIVGGQLLEEIDDRLSRSFYPEVKKVFGFEVTNRELYKIGLYSGEKKGFFRAHRDNFEAPLGYRRVATTIHLNDAYEGGGVRFPEYGGDVYRPKAGSAIAFSCGTLHEAMPVTAGERMVVVGFFHGAEDEAYRRYYQASRGEPLKLRDFTPTVLRATPGVTQSRDFYQDWWRGHVKIEE